MSVQKPEILITGGAGLIGSNLLMRLISSNVPVRATINRRTPLFSDDRIEYVTADLRRPDDCAKVLQGIRQVYHCAANTSGAAVMAATPMTHVTPNVLMNTQLLAAAHGAKVEKFLWLSSTTGYPPTGQRPAKEEEMFEGEPFGPYFFSGWTKRFTELLCQMYGEKLVEKMVTIVLRPTNIYGPNDDFELATSHVTAALIRKVVERWNPLEVWGTGEDIRDLLYVDDLVDAMTISMDKIESHQAFNIGYGVAYSVKEILSTILTLDGYDSASISYDKTKPSMIAARLVDITKARYHLGWTPKTPLAEGLSKTIDWYRRTPPKGIASTSFG